MFLKAPPALKKAGGACFVIFQGGKSIEQKRPFIYFVNHSVFYKF